MREFKTLRVLTALAATMSLLLFGALSFGSVASAQDYVPEAPPAVSSSGDLITFSGLEPGTTVVASFNLSGGAVARASATAGADGTVSFSVPDDAVSVAISVNGEASETIELATPAAPQPGTPAPAERAAGDLGDAPENLAFTGGSVATPLAIGLSLMMVGGLAIVASARATVVAAALRPSEAKLTPWEG